MNSSRFTTRLPSRLVPCLILVAIVFCASQQAHGQAVTAAGATAGDLSVSSRGDLEYEIPLVLPAGLNGVRPGLSLAYNSSGRNGRLGVGWSLRGLPAITRCNAVLGRDGFHDPVDFDENDRYCFDGQVLVPADGNYDDYLSAGKVFRTEIDSYAKIVAVGEQSLGARSFYVLDKNGMTRTFGGTDDSRIEAEDGTSVVIWALSREEDRAGNYFSVGYFEGESVEFYPVSIDYTLNDAVDGHLPAGEIRFIYDLEERPDPITRYEAGTAFRTSNRLDRIEAYSLGELKRLYRLEYETELHANISRLRQVTECGELDEFGNEVCFSPTVFSYTESSSEFLPGESPLAPVNGVSLSIGPQYVRPILIVGDFDGDSRDDLWVISRDPPLTGMSAVYCPSSVVLTDLDQCTNATDPDWSRIYFVYSYQVGDYDGDGADDLLVSRYGELLYFCSGDDIQEVLDFDSVCTRLDVSLNPVFGERHSARGGDFNGDGVTDVLLYGWELIGEPPKELADMVICFGPEISTGDTSNCELLDLPYYINPEAAVQVLDYDGDFVSDVFVRGGGAGNFYFLGGSREFGPLHPDFVGPARDLNGDGREDSFSGGDPFRACFSSGVRNYSSGGNGNIDGIAVCSGGPADFSEIYIGNLYTYTIADLNGDGYADVWGTRGQGYPQFRVACLGPFRKGVEAAATRCEVGAPLATALGNGMYVFGDFDGNGSDDVLTWTTNVPEGALIGLGSAQLPNLLRDRRRQRRGNHRGLCADDRRRGIFVGRDCSDLSISRRGNKALGRAADDDANWFWWWQLREDSSVRGCC